MKSSCLYYSAQSLPLTCFLGNKYSCFCSGCWCRLETGYTCCSGDTAEVWCFGAPARRNLTSGWRDSSGRPAWSQPWICSKNKQWLNVLVRCLDVLLSVFFFLYQPAVEAAVDDGIIHGGAHGQPKHWQVNLLDVLPLDQTFIETGHNEVDMIWQPAEGKRHHHNDHHFHHLNKEAEKGKKL